MDMRVLMKALGGIRGQLNRLEVNMANMQANQGKRMHRAEVINEVSLVFHVGVHVPSSPISFRRRRNLLRLTRIFPTMRDFWRYPGIPPRKQRPCSGTERKKRFKETL